MIPPITRRFTTAVTLVGGGPVQAGDLARALAVAPGLVAADQGADRLWALSRRPDLVVGDMDSISDLALWRARDVELAHLPEQDTTDFEKCLYSTDAPFYTALGFTGGRIDHTLAVFHTLLVRAEKRVTVLGEADAMAFLAPGQVLSLPIEPGARVSLFPFAETTGLVSEGLEWPVDGLTLAPGRQSGTSNRAVAATIRLAFDRPGCLLMLERRAFEALVAAMGRQAGR
ncbi:MAG: thiamine diphosphokinase [Pikeienuella sp.]